MVQVLPYVPSFGEKLSQTLGQAGADIGQGLVKRNENKLAQAQYQVLQDPNSSPMQKVNAFMRLPADIKKSSAPIWAAILGPQAQADIEHQQLNKFKESHFGNDSMPAQLPEGTNANVDSSSAQLPNAQQMMQEASSSGVPVQGPSSMEQQPQISSNASQIQSEQTEVDPNNVQTWPDQTLRELASIQGAPGKFAKLELDRREAADKKKTARESEIFSKNEPQLIKLGDELKDLNIEDTRLERLQVLFSDDSKFPNPTLAAIFSREGQINPVAASLLSPEAQESIKLTLDSLSGAQGTFGGKVSNFEAATYLKKNASLFNTPEGRKKILADQRAINKMNRDYLNGVLDIVDEKGGSDKISFSSAERLWTKRNEKKIQDLRDRFVNPDKNTFNSLPDAKKYEGRKVKNDKTGEVFISDGQHWKAVQGGK